MGGREKGQKLSYTWMNQHSPAGEDADVLLAGAPFGSSWGRCHGQVFVFFLRCNVSGGMLQLTVYMSELTVSHILNLIDIQVMLDSSIVELPNHDFTGVLACPPRVD